MNDSDLKEMGYRLTVRELIELRVRKSLQFGSDGIRIIASAADDPNEIRKLVANHGTRASELQIIFDRLGKGASYGNSTTHLGDFLVKPLDRDRLTTMLAEISGRGALAA